MRKYEKENVLKLLKALQDAYVKTYLMIKSQELSDVSNILTACQQAALSIGTSIESEGKNTEEVIAELEAYCDDIYLIDCNLENSGYDFDSIFKVINKRLTYIECFIREKIKVMYEVCFLPYSASMWDSLESVWEAAAQDQDCSCHVIPIPYYEKKGEAVVMKYEGAAMPEYVPVMPYRDYDFKERKPDVIYIHNPYDQYNQVTSVHPAFYSFELKKYTQMLVYIPYFITGGSVPESFRHLPVYDHMDKMIVQSDGLMDFFRKTIPEEKIVALGSPKADRIFSADNRGERIHEQWTSMIGNKRVILYNTSLSGLLKYREKAISKMEYVFSDFKDRKNEILLWRPHPLSKATLSAMLPQLYKKYCELEEAFLSENIGILDNTPDVSLSVAKSDAYIGEESSSIVHLFGVAGKPIFLLDMSISEKQEGAYKNLIGCIDACNAGDDLWFVHCHYNALCKLNINTGMTEIVEEIPEEAAFGERLYHDMLLIEDKLYCAPHKAKELAVYDMNKKQFVKIAFIKSIQDEKSQFTRMIRYGECLYFLPAYHQAVVRYNFKDGSLKYYTHLVSEVSKYDREDIENTPQFMSAMYVEGEHLLMASARSNVIVDFNMDTEQIDIHRVGKETSTYYRMEYDGNDYWLIPHDSRAIIKWNRKTGRTAEYSDYPVGFVGEKNAFLSIIYCGEYLLAFPKNANMIIKIDTATGSMSEFKISLPYREGERKKYYYNWPNNYYFVKKLDDTRVLAMTAYDSSLLIIDTKAQTCSIKKCTMEKRKPILEFGKFGDNYPYVCREGSDVAIDDFLNEIAERQVFDQDKQKNAYSDVVKNMDGSCGRRIHEYIMGKVKMK